MKHSAEIHEHVHHTEYKPHKKVLTFRRDLYEDASTSLTLLRQGSHIYWKTWKNIVHLENLEKSLNFAKNNKNHGNIMEF